MPVHGLLQTSVSTNTGKGESRTVGLLQDRTGVPAILLALESVQQLTVFDLGSLEQAIEKMRGFESASDRKAWEAVLAFFEAQGTEARVVGTPIGKDGVTLESLLGKNGGPAKRSGFHFLAEIAEFADLFIVPQAASCAASPAALRAFWEEMARVMGGLRGPFALLDAPLSMSTAEVSELVRGLDFPDAALFHPWLEVRGCVVAPSSVVAASIQRTDKEVGIHELPSNRPGLSGVVPIRELSPAELRVCRGARIGSFFIDDKGATRLWASDTLSVEKAPVDRLLSVRRTMQAIRVALEKICEPYVLEPMGLELPIHLETRLTNFLHSIRGRLDREQQPPYRVEVSMSEETSEPTMDVKVQLALPRVLEQIAVQMNLCA